MKKFDIKKLLILVLALVMVFALVACNKDAKPEDDGGDEPGPNPGPVDTGIYIQPADYFEALWNASSVLGSKEFKEEDSMALSADLDVKLALGNDVFDLGIAIGAVLDTTGANTAAKVKLYDKEASANWLTLYYFVNDQDNIYVEAYDQKLCIPVAMDTWGGSETFVADLLNGLLGKTEIAEGTTIVDLINTIKTAGGKDWTIDSMLFPLLKVFGLDLAPLLKTIGGLLPIDVPEGEDITTLLPILKSIGGVAFDAPKKAKGKYTGGCTREEIDGGYHYTGKLNSLVTGLIPGLLKDIDLGDLLANIEIALAFDTVEDATGIKDIDGFQIIVKSFGSEVAGGKDLTVQIGINEVKIENLGAAKADDAEKFFGIDKDNFKTNFNINLTVDLGITNKAVAIAYDDLAVDFTGNYKLVLNGVVDLKEGINTKADLALLVGDKAVASAYFGPQDDKVSQLVVKVDNTVTIDEEPVVATLAKLFAPYGLEALAKSEDEMFQKAAVDLSNAAFGTTFTVADDVLNAVAAWKEDPTSAFATYNSEFKGAAIMNLDLDTMAADLIASIFGEPAPAVSSAEPTLSISGLLKTVFAAISFEKGIEVKVDSILATIQAVFGGAKEADVLAMLKITETDLTGWWQSFFAGSSWIKANEVASLTNLLKSGAEVAISIGKVAQISAKVTTPDNATVTATIALKGEAPSNYEYKTIATTGLVLLNVVAE